MMNDLRIVIDTNVIVSALLFPGSVPRQALDRAFVRGVVLASAATLDELAHVLQRPRFNRYVDETDRAEFLANFIRDALPIQVTVVITACRDPRDDKFLELAVSGNATHIVTGDADVLAFHPFRGIAIMTPQDFLTLP